MYGNINKDDTISNVFYVIQFILYLYTLRNNTTTDGQVIYAGGLFI